MRQRTARDPTAVLTGPEHQVLALAADGLTAPWIAQRLSLPLRTVEAHLGAVQERLGASDRAGAVAEALRRGLLT